MEIDPKNNIAGIFVGETDPGVESCKNFVNTPGMGIIKKNLPDHGKTKYQISKGTQFSQFSSNKKI